MRALLDGLLFAFELVVIGRVVMSWVPPGGDLVEQIRATLATLTDWALVPIRRVLPPVRLGGGLLDLSPMVLIFAIILLRAIV
jgi:YggT family protein